MRGLITLSILLHVGFSLRVNGQDKQDKFPEQMEQVGRYPHPGSNSYPHLRGLRSPLPEFLSPPSGIGEASPREEDQFETPDHVLGDSVYEAWVARYDGPMNSYDAATALTVDGSGNVFVTGYSSSGVFSDYATVKYDASGMEQWVARYDGPGNSNDNATALAVDGSGNVYVTGWSYGSVTSGDYATIKYDALGVEQWIARYNGPGSIDDEALALAVDGSGNVYVTGYSSGSGTSRDYATIKYDASGVEQWVARYDGPGFSNDEARRLAVDGSGNVYVTGISGLYPKHDYATVKYDASGVEQWVARYNGPGSIDDEALALAVDGSGNVYVTGGSQGLSTEFDYATIKYDASGMEQWVARYDGSDTSDYASGLAVDGSGNVYVTGGSWGSGTSYDYATIKYDASGVEQWVARYNGPMNTLDFAYALAIDGSENICVTGFSIGSGTSLDYATIKYDASGVEHWVARYNGPANTLDVAYALAIDGSGNVYVAGYSYGSVTSGDYATIKYEQVATAVEEGGGHPTAFSLSQNYPNPFNPSTTIRYGLPNHAHVRLELFNTLGQRVASLVDEEQDAGYHEIVFQNNNLASGVYLYRLIAGEFSAMRKLLLLR